MFTLKIKEQRKLHNLTLEKLSKKLNIASSTLNQYENSRREIPLDILVRLSKLFNISVDEMLGINKDMQMPQIKDSIISLRKVKNLKQDDVAKILGKSQQAYSKYEQGLAEPDLETIKKICQLYNCSPNYLLGFEEDKPKTRIKKAVIKTYSGEIQ